jgi:hypothetical protein
MSEVTNSCVDKVQKTLTACDTLGSHHWSLCYDVRNNNKGFEVKKELVETQSLLGDFFESVLEIQQNIETIRHNAQPVRKPESVPWWKRVVRCIGRVACAIGIILSLGIWSPGRDRNTSQSWMDGALDQISSNHDALSRILASRPELFEALKDAQSFLYSNNGEQSLEELMTGNPGSCAQ